MEKDLEVGRCLSDDKRYADLLNGLLFEGSKEYRHRIYMKWTRSLF